MPDIVIVGEILTEIMTMKAGQTFLQAGELRGPYPSGAPAIFIDQAARMGASCGIISQVGDDDFGTLNVERLRRDGVDVSQIKIAKDYTTGIAFVTYYEDGSRHFVFHWKQSAAGYMTPDDVDEKYLDGCKYLHIMGCTISATDGARASVVKAAEAVKKRGGKVVFDPNLRPELLGNEKVKTVFQQILDMTDILLSGESELQAILGLKTNEETLAALRAKGIGLIVLKNGSRGIQVWSGQECTRIAPLKVEEVDPTGAGDCFDGAFIACLAEGKCIAEAAEIANAAGALSVTKKGPMEGAHKKEEILAFLKQSKG